MKEDVGYPPYIKKDSELDEHYATVSKVGASLSGEGRVSDNEHLVLKKNFLFTENMSPFL